MAVEIRARRLELGYTQEDLAGHCELDRPYISLIEVGKKQPTISVLHRLAVGLNFTFGEFAERIDRRYKVAVRAKARADQAKR
jgi:transcriptional regulator with XRE-family HTH domain